MVQAADLAEMQLVEVQWLGEEVAGCMLQAVARPVAEAEVERVELALQAGRKR